MCGISGFMNGASGSHDPGDLSVTARAMADAVTHRGPDDAGAWADGEAGVALGHRRLAIIDLTREGHQPMLSAEGRYVVVFNGEIYNFRELQAELAARGHRFRGHSDTEVLLAAVVEWGVQEAVRRFVGMFALALWDRQERRLHLCRDRLGEKPLYYGWVGGVFLFGSELKALRAHPRWTGEVNRDALRLYLRYNYIPAPYSIYEGIQKLVPGTVLTVSGDRPGFLPEPVPYWSPREHAERGLAERFAGSDAAAVDRLDEVLRAAVRGQMVADVPLGAFLSGGVDSSTIVALMQAQSAQPVKTFTIGFHERGFNEAEHAAEVAKHLGTEHTELYVTASEAMDVIPRLSSIYDEPFADGSQIPTFLVSQLARRHVTVSLSGDGGDELFGGYNRYFLGPKIWNRIRVIPRGGRRAIGHGLGALAPERWDRLADRMGQAVPALRHRHMGEKMGKLARVMSAGSPDAIFHSLVSNGADLGPSALGAREVDILLTEPSRWPPLDDFAERMMYLDALTYLPDDILVKVDRAAMAVNLETRVPFLDHRVVEFAWSLPLSMKVREGKGKWLLREVLDRYVPRSLIERPKMGFGVPLGAWLRGPLRGWAEELLDEGRLRREGFLDPTAVRRLWEEHTSGRADRYLALWSVLMFEAWLDEAR